MLLTLLAQATPELNSISGLAIGIIIIVVGGVVIAGIVGVVSHVGNAQRHLRSENDYVTTTQYVVCRQEHREDVGGLHDKIEKVHERVDAIFQAQGEATSKVLEAIAGLKE